MKACMIEKTKECFETLHEMSIFLKKNKKILSSHQPYTRQNSPHDVRNDVAAVK